MDSELAKAHKEYEWFAINLMAKYLPDRDLSLLMIMSGTIGHPMWEQLRNERFSREKENQHNEVLKYVDEQIKMYNLQSINKYYHNEGAA